MKIKCSNCGCEYEPAWNETSDCPICNNGSWKFIKTTTNIKESIN